MAHNCQRAQLNYCHVVIGCAGDEGTRPVRLHENAGCAMTDGEPLYHLARVGIQDDEVGAPECRYQDMLSVESELQTICPTNVGVKSLNNALAGSIDHRNAAILRIGYPYLLPIAGYVETFSTVAHTDNCLIPIAPNAGTTRRRCAGQRGGMRSGSWSMMLTVPELTLVVTT